VPQLTPVKTVRHFIAVLECETVLGPACSSQRGGVSNAMFRWSKFVEQRQEICVLARDNYAALCRFERLDSVNEMRVVTFVIRSAPCRLALDLGTDMLDYPKL
jgi:hypothetical protein